MGYNIRTARVTTIGDDRSLRPELDKAEGLLREHYSYEGGGADDHYDLMMVFVTKNKIQDDRIYVQISKPAVTTTEHERALAAIFGQKAEVVKRFNLNMTDIVGTNEWAFYKTVCESSQVGLHKLIGISDEAQANEISLMTSKIAEKIEESLCDEGLENLQDDVGEDLRLSSILAKTFVAYDVALQQVSEPNAQYLN